MWWSQSETKNYQKILSQLGERSILLEKSWWKQCFRNIPLVVALTTEIPTLTKEILPETLFSSTFFSKIDCSPSWDNIFWQFFVSDKLHHICWAWEKDSDRFRSYWTRCARSKRYPDYKTPNWITVFIFHSHKQHWGIFCPMYLRSCAIHSFEKISTASTTV